MQKRIRLSPTEIIPHIVSFWITTLVGGGYLFVGIQELLTNGLSVYGIYSQLFGLCIVLYGIVYFGFYLPCTPRVIIDDQHILIRKGVFSKSSTLNWKDIAQVRFGMRRLTFQVAQGEARDFQLNTSANTSKLVKMYLREIAQEKHISVIGG